MNIPIFSDTLSKEEMQAGIAASSDQAIDLKIIDNPDKYRSALSDPNVLVAIITAGGVVLAALISAFALIYVSRKKESKANGPGIIIINLNEEKQSDSAPKKIVIPLDDYQAEDHETEILNLNANPQRIKNISYLEEL